MKGLSPLALGAFYFVSEVVLALTRRARSTTKSQDRHSLALLWAAIAIGIFLSLLAQNYPAGELLHRRFFYLAGLLLFLAGVVLRWYAIIRLGRFFTVDVAIAKEHRVVESGPYRFIRHPSYTGALVAFLGFGLSLGNWLSILLLLLPITAAFLWRIKIEEEALIDGLGENYRAYMRRTKRLIPFVY